MVLTEMVAQNKVRSRGVNYVIRSVYCICLNKDKFRLRNIFLQKDPNSSFLSPTQKGKQGSGNIFDYFFMIR